MSSATRSNSEQVTRTSSVRRDSGEVGEREGERGRHRQCSTITESNMQGAGHRSSDVTSGDAGTEMKRGTV
jgi:hypothetical protein